MKYFTTLFFGLLVSLFAYAQTNPASVTVNGYTYNKCADEHNQCSFTYSRKVLYGSFPPADSTAQYGFYGPFTGGVFCDNGVGSDPAPGFGKACYYTNDNPPTVVVSGTTYTKCATEHSNCSFSGTGTVVFGAFPPNDPTAAYQVDANVAGGHICDSSLNGTDPAPGYLKACYINTTPPPPAPTVTLTANPASIQSGQSSTLSLTTSNATSCSGPVSGTGGTANVSPTATTSYTETCTGAGGSGSGSATVTVTQPPPPAPTATLTANPPTITSGQSSVLTLASTNATSCTGPVGGTSGTVSVSPTVTTSYSETCTGTTSPPATATATVTVGSSGGTIPTPTVNCGSPTVTALQGTNGLITVDSPSADTLRTFNVNQSFPIAFTSAATVADHVIWSAQDVLGHQWASGSFAVPVGPQTNTVTCTSTYAGYLQVTASLQSGGGSLPVKGTRPPGIASIGIVPNLSYALPAVTYAFPDQHRFGMQGFNSNYPALLDLGIKWTITNRQQSWGEPNGPNTYTPSNDLESDYTNHLDISRLIRLDGIPAWDSSTGAFNDSYSLPTNTAEYQSYMGRVGTDSINILNQYYPNQRYDYYQVTWEPSLGWVYPSSNFVTLYQLAYNGLHSTDTKAMVMGVANPFPDNSAQATGNYLAQYQPSGFCNYIDGVTTHAYYNAGTYPAQPPELQNQQGGASAVNSLNNSMHNLRAKMQSCKPNMVLWNTEMGISYDPNIAYGSAAITPNQLWAQAVVAARAHIIVLGEGAQVTTFFFGPDYPGEIGYGTYFDLNDAQGAYGATNLSPKPEAMALAALTHTLDGTKTLGKVNSLPATGYGYAFQQLSSNTVITALWVHDNAHWPVSGSYSTTYSVPYSLPVDAAGTAGNVIVLDAFGNPTRVAYSNGQVSLTLTESPIYVVSQNPTVTGQNVTAPVGYTGQ